MQHAIFGLSENQTHVVIDWILYVHLQHVKVHKFHKRVTGRQPAQLHLDRDENEGKKFFFAFLVLIDPIPADVYRYLTFLRPAAASNHNHDTWLADWLPICAQEISCSENSSLSPSPAHLPVFSEQRIDIWFLEC